MAFLRERGAFEAELEAYYSDYPADTAELAQHMDVIGAQHPEWLPYRRKALIYETVAERCAVKVFRHFPFYYEINTGKARTDLGAGGIGAWLKGQPFGQKLGAEGAAWWQMCAESGLSIGWPVLDDNHHCMANDNVFQHGLNGLLRKAQERLAAAETERQRSFLESMTIGLRSQIAVAGRFAREAERMLADERDPVIQERLRRLAAAASRVPAEPPATFYEALCAILFMREVTQALEGNGISILAHVDRILEPYYRSDLADGRLSREEAKDLLCFFLAMSDVRFGMREVRSHVGTNTTVMIGGCDAAGDIVFNDITRMVVEAYQECRFVDPKLNARISPDHPRDYFDLLAELIASGSNSLCVFNDDVIIAANARMGKAAEDCRLYVGGGCQENVLENTEVNSRATIYLSLAHVLLMGFLPETCRAFTEREGVVPESFDECATFDAFYETHLRNLKAVVDAHIDRRNFSEKEGWRFNPCPLHSATMSDCIANAKDMMEGGARYNFGSVSLTGIGTLIDSLYAVRRTVYEQRMASLSQLRDMLASNFEGEESFRQYLARRIPKFGQDDDGVREFAAKVFADVARVSSGRENTRGGRYEASLFSFRSFTDFGRKAGATPDGRRAGEHLSPGMSPSLLSLGEKCSIGQIMRSLEPLDLTLYPVVAVLDVKLPASRERYSTDVLGSVLRRFLDSGGSVLQLNWVDPAVLLDAREHPERHPDLVVRVSGYSAYFNTLSEAVQDEVIERTIADRTAGV